MIEDASLDTKYDDFAKHDGATERRPDKATATAAYIYATDTSKKNFLDIQTFKSHFACLAKFGSNFVHFEVSNRSNPRR